MKFENIFVILKLAFNKFIQKLINYLGIGETVCMLCSPVILDNSAQLQEKNDLLIDWISVLRPTTSNFKCLFT